MKRPLISFIFEAFICFIIPLEIVLSQSNDDCLTCHSDASLTMERNGKQISISVDGVVFKSSSHGDLKCIDCHKGYKVEDIPHRKTPFALGCTKCHNDISGKHVFHPELARSMLSGKTTGINCRECHDVHGILSSKGIDSLNYELRISESCRTCHDDVYESYSKSAHGRAVVAGITGSPKCLTCHQYEISNFSGLRDSLKIKQEQERMCLACHLDNPDVRAKTSPSAGFIQAYENSVHGTALREGNAAAATCINCHGSHNVAKGSEQNSAVSKAMVPATCGNCHGEITREYNESIHGVALKKGINDSPVCTDCHGEHDILSPDNPRSRVEKLNVSIQVCSPCHTSVRLTQKYGLSSDRFATFADSYHGLANKAGSVEVANCASCHGVHNIKSSTDSTSTIYKGNLVKTCGKCHPGANERFTVGSVHIAMNPTEEPLLYWISTVYILLIIVVIGGMVLHNIFDFIKKSKRKLLIRRGAILEHYASHRLYLRMSLNERIQHGTLLISFTTLVLTGFALRYPDAWWVVYLRNLSPMMFEVRGIVHRIAGVLLLVVSLYHLYYITFVPRGKRLIRDLLPERKDITDFIDLMKYNFGLSQQKPQCKRFSYIEKSEYWALVWGTIIMGATGLILWFDNTFLGLLTKLGWDAAREVHYYEAWLATLAIIVWHLYFVIFNPDVYPLNVAFWKGTLTEEEMIHEHPLELEEIKRNEAASSRHEEQPGQEINDADKLENQ
jgi:cytochrome b subunit of formate dehydrogenase